MKYSLLLLDRQRRVAVYDAPEDLQSQLASVGARVVRSKTGERTALAVPVSEEAVPLLWKHGIAAVHPVELDYDWPGGPPFEAQARTVGFLLGHERCFCFNEMGTGKTRAVLWALDWLLRKQQINRALIVAPVTTLRSVWLEEIERYFFGRLRAVLLYGTREERLEALQRPGWNVAVINPDGLKPAFDGLRRVKWDCAVIDEAAAFRHHTSQRSRLLFQLLHGKPSVRRIWALTGTPVPNGPILVYGLLRLVHGWSAGRFTVWRDRVAIRYGMHEWRPRPQAELIVREALQPAVAYRREHMYDLPPEMTVDRQVELSPEQVKLVRQLQREGAAMLADGRITVANAGALLTKVLQLLQGAVYSDDGGVVLIPAPARQEAVREIVQASYQPVIVFALYRHVMDDLMEQLSSWPVARIDGSTPVAERARIVDEFQRGQWRVLVAHPRTMGHGLTLTAASTIVWYGPTFDLELYDQAVARIARVSQQRQRLIVRLWAHPVERRVYQLLAGKTRLQAQVLDLVRDFVREEDHAEAA